MNNPIVIAIISAGLSAFVTCKSEEDLIIQKNLLKEMMSIKSGWMNKIKNIWKFHQSLGYMRQILFLDYVSILFYMPGLHIPNNGTKTVGEKKRII